MSILPGWSHPNGGMTLGIRNRGSAPKAHLYIKPNPMRCGIAAMSINMAATGINMAVTAINMAAVRINMVATRI